MTGAATNAGIDFQQRVGAVAMLALLGDVVDLSWLWREAGDQVVTEVRFETDDGVDDLVIVTEGPRAFVQAKRSLDLSALEKSDFVSAISQFVEQFTRDAEREDVYVLAVSPRASRRIAHDLRKLTEAARLNELGSAENPLTQTEQDVLEKTYTVITEAFRTRTGRDASVQERDAIFSRIRVALLDLERDGALERAILVALAARTRVLPDVLWASLIALGLSLAKDRLSIDRRGVEERLGHFFVERTEAGRSSETEDAVKIVVAERMSAGREVVLAVDEDGHVILAELIRFDDDGSRRVRFVDGSVEMGNGVRWQVLRRAATMAGIERLIVAEPTILEGREVILFPINSDEDYDASPWAQAHAALCQELMQSREEVLECLQCGRPISEGSPQAVEIDEEGLPHQMGLVHTACLRPTHRAIGRVAINAFENQPLPSDFDHRTWIETRPTGQGAFNGLSPALQGRIVHLGWKPGRAHLAVGNWGVAYTLEDGSVRCVSERGRTSRLSKGEATEQARVMNESAAEALATKDPFCVSERTGMFSKYSLLLQSDPGAKLLKVLSADPRELTRFNLLATDQVDNFYAPLVALIDAETGKSFVIGNARVLLTEPLQLQDSIENWKTPGINVPLLATSVIRSDDQFDAFVVTAFREDVGVVIDPILAPSGEPLTGFLVVDIEALFERAKRERGGETTAGTT